MRSLFPGAFFYVPVLGLSLGLLLAGSPAGWAIDLADLAADPLGVVPGFQPPTRQQVEAAAHRLRSAVGPLDQLLKRSRSGEAWRDYLGWQTLQEQVAAGPDADVGTLAKLYQRFDAEENGLEMHQFVAVRRGLAGLIEAVSAAAGGRAADVYSQRLEKLSALVAGGAAAGTTESLEGVGPLLARLSESGQAAGVIARVRSALDQPNLYLDVEERLLGSAVNRVVDETETVDEIVLGNRARGIGRTSGLVLLDFVPSTDRAVVDVTLAATNESDTKSTRGPVTVCSHGTTEISARKRILIDEERFLGLPVESTADAHTRTTGIGIRSKVGQQFIRKIASRKVAELRPQAEAIMEQRVRERVRREFESQLADPLARATRDYQTKFRGPLLERGWYPELLRMSSSDTTLSVKSRKALSDQISAFTPPPGVDADAVLSVRVHETLVSNAGEVALGGRTITQEFVEEQIRDQNGTLPASLASDPDQPPWSITFAKQKPIELDANDGRVKMTVRGSRYTSGDREFPAMDVWVEYRIEPAPNGIRLIREGDVQIYPPGFVPGGGEKLSVSQTSLRRILQKRFGKVFQEVVDVEPLDLPGQLASAGPLPMEQMEARRDGWVAVAWRAKDDR
jgi:hypothetical protein